MESETLSCCLCCFSNPPPVCAADEAAEKAAATEHSKPSDDDKVQRLTDRLADGVTDVSRTRQDQNSSNAPEKGR